MLLLNISADLVEKRNAKGLGLSKIGLSATLNDLMIGSENENLQSFPKQADEACLEIASNDKKIADETIGIGSEKLNTLLQLSLCECSGIVLGQTLLFCLTTG